MQSIRWAVSSSAVLVMKVGKHRIGFDFEMMQTIKANLPTSQSDLFGATVYSLVRSACLNFII